MRRDIICAVDIGTSKICVMVGLCEENMPLQLIGHSEVPLNGEVIKGEIVDMPGMLEKFVAAIEQADASCGMRLNNAVYTSIAVSGCGISSYQDFGQVLVDSEDNKVSPKDLEAAGEQISKKSIGVNQEQLHIIDICYQLDNSRHASNPIGQVASSFKLFCHIIYGDTSRLNNFRELYAAAGFEDEPMLVFSGLTDLFIVDAAEREKGVLLIDFGRGTTEYIVHYKSGVIASGTIPVGFDNVANDIAIGLNLNIEDARKILTDNTLTKAISGGASMIQPAIPGAPRRIPVASFEKIIDARLREIFTIIKSKVSDQDILRGLAAGGVMTGGGALFPRSIEIASTVFELPIRVGAPYSGTGELDEFADPRYSTVWTALRFTDDTLRSEHHGRARSFSGAIFGTVGTVGDAVWRAIAGIKRSIKI